MMPFGPGSAPPSDAQRRAECARHHRAAWVRRLLIGVALAFMTLFLFVPLVAVFSRRCEGLGGLPRRHGRARCAVGHQADADRRGIACR
jgi:hypothetical protein